MSEKISSGVRVLLLLLILQVFLLGTGREALALNDFDQELFREINSNWKNPVLDEIMKYGTHMGDGLFALGLIGGLYLYGEKTGNEKFMETARVGLGAFLKSGLLAQAGKHIFQRPRPGLVLDDVNFNGTPVADRKSFPSGHTTTAFSLATVLAGEFPAYKKLFYTGAGLVGVSRIYNGVHFPTDVLAGAILGYLIGKDALESRLMINEEGFLVYVFSF